MVGFASLHPPSRSLLVHGEVPQTNRREESMKLVLEMLWWVSLRFTSKGERFMDTKVVLKLVGIIMKSYKALVVRKAHQDTQKKVAAQYEQREPLALGSAEVLINVCYSSINYKDALGITGKGKIFRSLPIVPGIDASGIVVQSKSKDFREGDHVLVTGCGLGEIQDGGYAEYLKVPADWVIPIPTGLSVKDAMILGTAGFTAAICIHRMERNGQSPEKGPIIVTGASGGVGSFCINILSSLGYDVVAVSGKNDISDYLMGLGAKEILDPQDFLAPAKPLETSRWGGCIDNVGGKILASILPRIHLWGNCASVGLALSHELHGSVMPFILRGVSLLGVSSANCPKDLRVLLWKKLSQEYRPRDLDKIVQNELPLGKILDVCPDFIARKTFGRYLVDCRK